MCYKTCWLGNDIKMHKMSANSIFINEIIKKKYLNTLKKSLFIYFVHILEKKSLFFVRPVLNIQYKPKNMENIQD